MEPTSLATAAAWESARGGGADMSATAPLTQDQYAPSPYVVAPRSLAHGVVFANSFNDGHSSRAPRLAEPTAMRPWPNSASASNNASSARPVPEAAPTSSTLTTPSVASQQFSDAYTEGHDYRSRQDVLHYAAAAAAAPPAQGYHHDPTTTAASSQPDAWRSHAHGRPPSAPTAVHGDGHLTLQIPKSQDFHRTETDSHQALEGLPYSLSSSPQPGLDSQYGQPRPRRNQQQYQQQHHHQQHQQQQQQQYQQHQQHQHQHQHQQQQHHQHHPQQSQQEQHRRQSTHPRPHQVNVPPPAHALSIPATASGGVSSPAPSLPSFAAFQEHANRDDADESTDAASMNARVLCLACSKLKPQIRDVAIAVTELDDDVQVICQKGLARQSHKFPSDSPVRTTQWIISRLRDCRADLMDAYQRGRLRVHSTQPSADSPPSTLKRPLGQWDRDEPYDAKRMRSNDQSILITPGTPHDRRGSTDFLGQRGGQPRPNLSPPPSDMMSGPGYSKPSTPPMSSMGGRPMPSPSPMSYAVPSAANIQTPLTAHSMDPGSAYPHQSGGGPSAQASQMADMQHQIHLKTLAHQTLQTEYASLLQKLQKERVKNQSIEKKTSVSNHEVQELSGKNDELGDRVKLLEEQLEESEKRREADRVKAAAEKEQWGRMLEMSGRIQARTTEERQKLTDETAKLKKIVTDLQKHSSPMPESDFERPLTAHPQRSALTASSKPVLDDASSPAPIPASSSTLERQNGQLKAQVDTLRAALQEITRQSKIMDLRAQDLLQQNSNIEGVVEKALRDVAMREEPSRTPKRRHATLNASSGVASPRQQQHHVSSTFRAESGTTAHAATPPYASSTRTMDPSRPASRSEHSSTPGSRDDDSDSPRSHDSSSPQATLRDPCETSTHAASDRPLDNVPGLHGLMPPPSRPVAAWQSGF